jgi:hypothetical protein
LDDRAQEICEPLLAVAEVVGGSWPERARRAVIALAGASAREDSDSLGVRLLRDIRAVFDEKKADRLPTGKLLEALHAVEEAPWGSLRGESLDARTLARMLKPYGIKPEKLREGEHTFRGYRRASFEDAWTRYTPSTAEEGEHPEHPEHPAKNAGPDVPHKQNVPEHGGYPEHEKPHKKGDVPRVPNVPHNPGAVDSVAAEVADFLREPPPWYRRQAEECARQGAPERLLRPLACATAYHVLSNTNRWSEVLPHIEAALREGSTP